MRLLPPIAAATDSFSSAKDVSLNHRSPHVVHAFVLNTGGLRMTLEYEFDLSKIELVCVRHMSKASWTALVGSGSGMTINDRLHAEVLRFLVVVVGHQFQRD